ncbi:MFS transporter [Granulosicoccus antarcticus]|uniref:Inner membrane transport protein YajR n=1 Tax=Granulosicoccus antarcticus IMCC3135 TaxID=1192854 RepID=A0A2Z2NKP3_9GAMM|nr:MFS transporter [Granulosicoccus antarcticus]ASJ71876.1 Inner membrane transport protein YajR [Granulosicoccus antarcticus IMCC3135]
MNDSNQSTPAALLPRERRAAWSLSLIYMIRMVGLFIVLPVFSLFGDHYTDSTPFLIGLAIGIYGLLQACLQIPFGMLSDRIGRKKVVTIGLLLLALGSVVAASSESIYGVIIGRTLQGSGAIAAALMALAADLTRDEQRTKVMASIGASIGFAFILALILGPLLIGWFSINGLFWLTAASALVAILLLHTVVPNPDRCHYSADTGANLTTMKRLFHHPQLVRLDISIFMLHLMITAIFFAVPLGLRDAGMQSDRQWLIYLPAVVLSFAVMIPLIIWGERKAMRAVLLLCITGMALTQLLFAGPLIMGIDASVLLLFLGITVFFCFMNTLEALLPSLVSRLAPAAAKGSAMGIYSTSQFMGSFVGGVGAGWLYGTVGPVGLFATMAVLCVVWLLLLAGFEPPRKMATHRRALSDAERHSTQELLAELKSTPGVEEVVIAMDEGVAYLKVDKARFEQPGPVGEL